jgi:uncharacterized membrane protein
MGEMATEIDPVVLLLVVTGLGLLLFFLYISSIEKVFEKVGFSREEAATILTVTLLFGWITIPLFPYSGYWIGISIGGGIIPLIICYYLVRSGRVHIAEGAIGIIIVSVVTYFITRAEEGVGIVADLPIAFAPALAAGLFAFTTFWIDIKKAAPLAYFSGVLGTLIGADVFHLGDILAFPAPADQTVTLSIGGANIFDMVYLTGVIAVIVDIVVFWIRFQERKHGFERVLSDWEKGAEGLPYAREVKAEPTLKPGRRGKLQ